MSNSSLQPGSQAVTGKLLTGHSPANVVAATDTILQGFDKLDLSVTAENQSGFDSWGGAGNYYSTSGAQFTVLRSGVGYLKSKKITWAGGENVTFGGAGMYFVGYTATNTLTSVAISTLLNADKNTQYNNFLNLYLTTVVLFEVWYDGISHTVCRENHPYMYPTETSVHQHIKFGQTFSYNGGVISLFGAATNLQVQISGEDLLEDHGVESRVVDGTGAAMTFITAYKDGSGNGKILYRFNFTVSGITVTPTFGATYTNNGSTFTILRSSIVAGAGTLFAYRSSGTANPLASGTLTKTSGTGDASITFSANTVPSNTVPLVYINSGVPTPANLSGTTDSAIVAVYATKDDYQTPSTVAPAAKFFILPSTAVYGTVNAAANSIGTGTAPDLSQFVMPDEMNGLEMTLAGFVTLNGSGTPQISGSVNGFTNGVRSFKQVANSSFSAGAVAVANAVNVQNDTTNFNHVLSTADTTAQAAFDTLDNKANLTYSAASDPGVNNDGVDTAAIGQKFVVGDQWLNTATKTVYVNKDITTGAAVWQSLASGSGSGELNYITNPSMATATTGWTLVGTGLALARETTAANLPRENLTGTGISILGTAATETSADYVYFNFTLDDVDGGAIQRVLKIQWDQKIIGAYTAGLLAVTITDQSNVLLATPTITAIPASDGTFGCTWVSTSTQACRLKIAATGAIGTGAGIVISNVIVGPGTSVQGAPISDWQSFTPTGSWVSNTTYTGRKRYIGDSVEYDITLDLAGAPTSANLTVNIPDTIDTSKLSSTNNANLYNILGVATIQDNGVGSYTASQVTLASATSVYVTYDTGTGAAAIVTQAAPITFANGDVVRLHFTVPVVGHSSGVYLGSGADNAVTPLNWTAFTPTWNNVGTGTTGYAFYRRVADGMEIVARFDPTGAGSASQVTLTIPGGKSIDSSKIMGGGSTEQVGSGVWATTVYTPIWVGVNSNALTTVALYQTGNGNTLKGSDLSNGNTFFLHAKIPIANWTAQDYLGKMLTGFATAKVGSAGLVNNDSSNLTGTPILGRTDGGSASSGYIGQYIESAAGSGASLTNNQYSDANVTKITLTPGTWEIQATSVFSPAASTSVSTMGVYIGTATGNSSTGIDVQRNGFQISTAAGVPVGSASILVTPVWRVRISSNTDYYCKAIAVFSVSTMTAQGFIRASRIQD